MVKETKGKKNVGTTAPPAGQPAGGRKTAGESEVWEPIKRGDLLEGTFKSVFHFLGKKFKKEQSGYKVLTAEGMRIVFGSAVLDRLMEEIPKDSKVWITFLGRVKQGDNENVKDWNVEYE